MGGYDGRGYYDDEDNLGPYADFVETANELFDRTQAAFDYGNMSLARAGYLKLFEQVLTLTDDYGRGIQLHDVRVNPIETGARCLLAVYETEPALKRVPILFEQMQLAQTWLRRPSPPLSELIEISAQPLPEPDGFMEKWIAFLHKQEGAEADTWLREAIRLAEGSHGLELSARSEGGKHPRAFLDWVAALYAEGKAAESLTAAQLAIATPPARVTSARRNY